MILPSIRVIVRLAKNSPKNQSRIPEPTNVNKSKLVIPLRWSGVILALHPNTKKILKRLLPITLPMAISGFFFNAATMEVASSGREVPPATKVRPIIDSLTPRLRAIPVAPSTNNCPPYISAARPPMIYRVDFHQGSDLISSSSAECSAGCALSVIGLEGPEEAIA